jgi:hypothetical protein
MGTYNKVHGTIACPRCGIIDNVEVEVRLGNTTQVQELRLGDRYPWVPHKQPHDGGRPEDGNAEGDGYMECDHCHKDSFLRVLFREDVIIGIEPNLEKKAHIPD